jgi:hypothetical protein
VPSVFDETLRRSVLGLGAEWRLSEAVSNELTFRCCAAFGAADGTRALPEPLLACAPSFRLAVTSTPQPGYVWGEWFGGDYLIS